MTDAEYVDDLVNREKHATRTIEQLSAIIDQHRNCRNDSHYDRYTGCYERLTYCRLLDDLVDVMTIARDSQ